ncbi:OmpA family protein [Burkholderia pyrrocinia]|uniref:OmpA family protein n=1 Tax=Burkholderia pyrrocinia TaxID=60550 RepID=UPI001FC8E8C5|nr:OmpA family protein [Burkholderia pyrrocinia]
MKNTTIAMVCIAAAVAGCSSASGPTFDAYSDVFKDRGQAYRVRCDGLLEGERVCFAKARTICDKQEVTPIEALSPYGKGEMVHVLTFQCGTQPQPAPQPAAVVAPVPAPAPTPTVPRRITLRGDANFDFDKAVLNADARSRLDKLISDARGMTFRVVTAEGHTDGKGDTQYNIDLAQQRAQAVVNYLRNHGLNAQHYVVETYGKASPIATNATDEGRAQNRRVEILLDPIDP